MPEPETHGLTPHGLRRFLTFVVLALVGAHVATQVIRLTTGHDYLLGITPLVSLDGENNIPAWASTLLLGGAALLLALVGRDTQLARRPFVRHWYGLALLFAIVSFDEMSSWHETTSAPIRDKLGAEGSLLHYGWVLPVGVLLIVLAVVYLKWLRSLPGPTRKQFILAAVLYVGGALGIEMLEGQHAGTHGFDGFGYMAYVTIEETLELVGVSVFLVALLAYRQAGFGAPAE